MEDMSGYMLSSKLKIICIIEVEQILCGLESLDARREETS